LYVDAIAEALELEAGATARSGTVEGDLLDLSDADCA